MAKAVRVRVSPSAPIKTGTGIPVIPSRPAGDALRWLFAEMAGLALWRIIALLQGCAEKSAFCSEPALLYGAAVKKIDVLAPLLQPQKFPGLFNQCFHKDNHCLELRIS